MKLETDIKTIERLAERNQDADWEFRSYLKGVDLPSEEIDAVVHRLYKTVSEQIDCRKCGNCCKIIGPRLKDKDIERLSAHLKLTHEAFAGEYLSQSKDEDGCQFKASPCQF